MTSANVANGSKPYIVEDRPMISRSSGDRGEMRLQSFYFCNYALLTCASEWNRCNNNQTNFLHKYNSQNNSHHRTWQRRDGMSHLLLFAARISHFSKMSLFWLPRIHYKWDQGIPVVSSGYSLEMHFCFHLLHFNLYWYQNDTLLHSAMAQHIHSGKLSRMQPTNTPASQIRNASHHSSMLRTFPHSPNSSGSNNYNLLWRHSHG